MNINRDYSQDSTESILSILAGKNVIFHPSNNDETVIHLVSYSYETNTMEVGVVQGTVFKNQEDMDSKTVVQEWMLSEVISNIQKGKYVLKNGIVRDLNKETTKEDASNTAILLCAKLLEQSMNVTFGVPMSTATKHMGIHACIDMYNKLGVMLEIEHDKIVKLDPHTSQPQGSDMLKELVDLLGINVGK